MCSLFSLLFFSLLLSSYLLSSPFPVLSLSSPLPLLTLIRVLFSLLPSKPITGTMCQYVSHELLLSGVPETPNQIVGRPGAFSPEEQEMSGAA